MGSETPGRVELHPDSSVGFSAECRFHDALMSVGRRSRDVSLEVLRQVVAKLDPGPGGRIEWLYGHNWVTLAWPAKHPLWGVFALPLRSLLYMRAIDVPQLDERYGWEFATKHQLAARLVLWFVETLRLWGLVRAVWVVVDGAYAERPFLDAILKVGVTVVSRLRKDAELFDLPPSRRPGQRGRPPVRGAKLSLAKRASHPEGWQSIVYHCRGVEVTRDYKTFIALSTLTEGLVRVVLVRFEDGGWIPYFRTDPNASVRDILEVAAARWAIEEHFHDVQEIWAAGQQQVRHVWSNIGCWNPNGWMFTLVELAAWDRPATARGTTPSAVPRTPIGAVISPVKC